MGDIHDSDPFSGYSINVPQESAKKSSSGISNVSQLMALTDEEWAARSTDLLNDKMIQYYQEIVPEGTTSTMPGFLEKHELERDSQVAVIGDIHGNGLRLDLTLKALQQQGFLDKEFHCLPGKTLVFLGDYVDRGQNNLKVLELLITLKMENPTQVHLIRGNHEDLQTSEGKLDRYAANDPKYLRYMKDVNNLAVIDRFYKSLPVAVYIGQKTDSEKMQYMQFCHGLFHLYTDPAPLLAQDKPNARLWVDGAPGFSHRIQTLMVNEPKEGETDKQKKLREAAKQLKDLESKIPVRFDDIYWLDAGATFSYSPATGRTTIAPEMVKAYLQISGSDTAKIKEVIRGHQNGVWTVKGQEQKVVVTTLDPSSEEDLQVFMEIKLADKVRDWSKSLVSLPLTPDHDSALKTILTKNANAL